MTAAHEHVFPQSANEGLAKIDQFDHRRGVTRYDSLSSWGPFREERPLAYLGIIATPLRNAASAMLRRNIAQRKE